MSLCDAGLVWSCMDPDRFCSDNHLTTSLHPPKSSQCASTGIHNFGSILQFEMQTSFRESHRRILIWDPNSSSQSSDRFIVGHGNAVNLYQWKPKVSR